MRRHVFLVAPTPPVSLLAGMHEGVAVVMLSPRVYPPGPLRNCAIADAFMRLEQHGEHPTE
jgi:hypothetical protein